MCHVHSTLWVENYNQFNFNQMRQIHIFFYIPLHLDHPSESREFPISKFLLLGIECLTGSLASRVYSWDLSFCTVFRMV